MKKGFVRDKSTAKVIWGLLCEVREGRLDVFLGNASRRGSCGRRAADDSTTTTSSSMAMGRVRGFRLGGLANLLCTLHSSRRIV